MAKEKLKVTLTYRKRFTQTEGTYIISKIVGAPTVEVHDGRELEVRRAGDEINEGQAEELAQRVDLTTVPSPDNP